MQYNIHVKARLLSMLSVYNRSKGPDLQHITSTANVEKVCRSFLVLLNSNLITCNSQ